MTRPRRDRFTRAELARAVKEAVTPHMVAAIYGITFDRGGFACCPFHGERTPSFHITRDQTAFHCFGCGVSPDVIDLTMHMEGLDFGGALRRLNTVFSLGLPLDGEEITYRQQREMQRKQAERMRVEQAEKNARAAWDGLWDTAMTELAECDRALRDLGAGHPKGTPIDEPTAKRLAELYGRRDYAVYQYESLPDEAAFVERRRRELMNAKCEMQNAKSRTGNENRADSGKNSMIQEEKTYRVSTPQALP